MFRRTLLALAGPLLGLAAAAAPAPSHAAGVLTVAMTAGDLPITTGTPDQGFEGFRFVGFNIYEALTSWDLSKSDKASELIPGLATKWEIDPKDKTRWIFHLRQGVKWQDGCPFTADDVVWNFQRLTDEKAPQYNSFQRALTSAYLTSFKSIEKVDDTTVAITTKTVDSLFPYPLSLVVMISPCRAKELKYDWEAYAQHPSGTGPYVMTKLVPHERMELVPNKTYWNKDRIPKQDMLVLLPMPEAATRTAALLSGQVNFVEAPAPDAVPRLKSSGMKIITNIYPHNWSYQLNFVKGAFQDLRVRRAANYALNRADMKEMLGGMMEEGFSTIPPSTPYFGHPILYKHDTAKATALLKEAGCYPCAITLAISTSGSGQMQSLPMNELVKSQLEEAGFKVKFDVMDWNALLNVGRGGVDKFPDIDGINISRAAQDPFYALIRHVARDQWAPTGSNWGHYDNPAMDKLITEIKTEFDPAKQLALEEKLNEMMNDQAVMIWVAHDVNPRAISPKVHGFVQAQSWFQDLTPITVSP
jgi:peptide/nickel transport system substrate-binding protein